VLDRISTELSRRHREAHGRLVDELDSERYLTLLDDLDHLLAEPPLTDRAQRPARKELRRLVHAAARRVERRAERADAATGAERDEALHEVRKAAKRARYAAEATEVVLGKPATKQAAAMEAVQELLGEVQDSVASRDLLRELAMVAHLAHENAFTYGVLHGRQALAAHEALDDYPRRRRRARKASL
jgi:CHAD domain-containing protein